MSVRVGLLHKDGRAQQLRLLVVPLICEPLTYQPISFCRVNFDHRYDLDLADLSNSSSCAAVDILIGSDLYWDLVTGESHRGTSGPVAIKTVFGWVLSGHVKCGPPDESSTCLVTHILWVDGLSQSMQVLDDQLKAFWELESFGISTIDRSIHDKFEDTVRFINGRYEVELPWKESHPTLHEHYHLSLS